MKQVTVSLEGAVRLMGKDFLRKHFSKLDAFLVEAVDVPYEALEHDLVFEMGKQGADCFRRKLVTGDNAGGSSALEIFVRILILLSAGESHDLGGHICAEFLLAGAVLDHHVRLKLALAEADKLDRDNVRALMQELIEGMLAVGSRLAEDHRSGLIGDRFREAVYALSVRFHIQLLEMCREAAQRL